MSDQEINDALDALEAEHGGESVDYGQAEPEHDLEPAQVDEDLEQEQAADDESPEPEESPKEKPPGFLSYQEWVDQGRDPADYRGENAYKAEYERINEIRDLKDTMNKVVKGVDEWKQNQQQEMQEKIERARSDAMAEMQKAKDDLDIDGALAAQKKLDSLEYEAAQSAPEPSPVIQEFISKNPIIDQSSSEFDRDFYDDMGLAQAAIVNQLTGGQNVALSPQQIQRTMTLAYERTKELHADKFHVEQKRPAQSKRNQRQSTAAPAKRRAQDVDYGSRLKTARFKTKNPRNESAANDIYEMLKASDPKAAEQFARNLTGE